MLYIRHAQKLYRNGSSSTFSLDPGITNEGREAAKLKFSQLIKLHGIPSKIISSPYLRTRETAQIAHDVIFEASGKSIEITYEPLIGEYLGHHNNKDISKCLRSETLIHNPIFPEDWVHYSQRIRKYLERDHDFGWYITHGIVIQSISVFSGKKINYPNELEGIIINSNEINKI